MTLEEFKKIIDEKTEERGSEAYLVHIRERYAWEKTWDSFNILYMYDDELDAYVWDWDFWEGQEYVEVLGFIDLDDIEVPDYNSEGR